MFETKIPETYNIFKTHAHWAGLCLEISVQDTLNSYDRSPATAAEDKNVTTASSVIKTEFQINKNIA